MTVTDNAHASAQPAQDNLDREALDSDAGRDAGGPHLSLAALEDAVRSAHGRYRDLAEGENFPHPVLARVPAHYFGIALSPVGGEAVVTAGDARTAFAIQSVAKVATLALVLQESGADVLEDAIGAEATGRVFNSIEAIEALEGRGQNPMVTPGAIAAVGLVKGGDLEEIWTKILEMQSAFAGRPLRLNEEVYAASSQVNQRNRAIGALMSAYGRFPGDPAAITDVYTRQCAIEVTTVDLGIMAGTLAAGGRNPLTQCQVVDERHIPEILAIMATAGLYDRSGHWLFRTGLPAKSGVGGGMIAVAPGKFGIAAYSPPLDAAGNSVRGQRAIADISAALSGNPYSGGSSMVVAP